jgi:hypothetical protein
VLGARDVSCIGTEAGWIRPVHAWRQGEPGCCVSIKANVFEN